MPRHVNGVASEMPSKVLHRMLPGHSVRANGMKEDDRVPTTDPVHVDFAISAIDVVLDT